MEGGACMAGGVHGRRAGVHGKGACAVGRGQFWQGVCMAGGMLDGGVCMAGGGMCGRGACMVGEGDAPLWTEFLTNACKNITFTQLRCGRLWRWCLNNVR